MASTADPRPSRTWAAVVALIRPEGLAEGAASGIPACFSSACITGWAGTRMATLAARGDRGRQRRARGQRENKRQGAGPEGFGQGLRLGRQDRDAPDGIDIRQMHDQRIEPGPPLGREDARHGVRVRRVGGQPVDGLRRHGHEAALPQKVAAARAIDASRYRASRGWDRTSVT
jgi:hypothetical protein